jgi:hypothetical protein
MAEALTYNSLISDVQSYAERSDAEFVSQLPRFIMLAENRLASEIRGLGYLRIANFTMTTGNPVIEKPSRWRETESISIQVGNSKKFLKLRGLQYIQSYWPDSSIKDEPYLYSNYDYEHWLIAPTPDIAYSATVNYYERPQPLDDANQTNWTTQYAPQLLLYATLLEVQPFLKTGERLQEFQMMFDRAAMAVNKENANNMTDRTSNRGQK